MRYIHRIIILVFTSAIGGFLFGYDTGVVSGVSVLLEDKFKLSHMEIELFVSLTILSAFLSSLFSGYMNDKIGRKWSIIVSSLMFIIGPIVVGLSGGVVQLFIGRLIIGIGVGISAMTVPLYLSEISPPEYRGKVVTINTFCITFGQWIANFICYFLQEGNGWRYVIAFASIPAVLQMVIFITVLPESPRYMMIKNDFEKADKILSLYRNDNFDIQDEISGYTAQSSQKISIIQLFKNKDIFNLLKIGVLLQFTQQIIGINTIIK